MMFSLRLRISRKSADWSSRASAASIDENENVARPFCVYDVSKKSTLPSSSCETFSRYASGFVTAPWIVGSSSSESANVLAKQPASVA